MRDLNDRPWEPLLHGAAAEETRQVLRAIGDRLTAGDFDLPGGTRAAGASEPYPGLSAGTPGLALALRYLDDALPGRGYGEAATQYLDAAASSLADWPMGHGLFAGFSGVAWAVRHLEDDPGDATEDLDRILLSILDRSPSGAEYDLIRGLVGVGVYGIEALPAPFGRHCMELVLQRLDELHEEVDDGITWFTPPEHLPPRQLSIAPHGYYNLGVAHGVPGVIVFLAACCAAEVAVARSRPLLDGAVAWLLAQRQEPQVGSHFGGWIGEGLGPIRSRLAWCYGDPGVGAALVTAGGAAGEERWRTEGTAILRHAARRPAATAQIRDACLCHGTAGLAHLFHRAYQATGDEELRSAAVSWYRQTLAMRRPGEGIAGFLAWAARSQDDEAYQADAGLLTGVAGIALALAAAVTPTAPAWDLLFALSIPSDRRVGRRHDLPTATAGDQVAAAEAATP